MISSMCGRVSVSEFGRLRKIGRPQKRGSHHRLGPHHDVTLRVVMAAALEHLHDGRFPDTRIPDDHYFSSKHQRRSVRCLHASESTLERRRGSRRGRRSWPGRHGRVQCCCYPGKVGSRPICGHFWLSLYSRGYFFAA